LKFGFGKPVHVATMECRMGPNGFERLGQQLERLRIIDETKLEVSTVPVLRRREHSTTASLIFVMRYVTQ